MKKLSVIIAASFLAFAACLLSLPIAGQNPSSTSEPKAAAPGQEPLSSNQTIRVTSSLVNVLFTVYDKKNRMVVEAPLPAELESWLAGLEPAS